MAQVKPHLGNGDSMTQSFLARRGDWHRCRKFFSRVQTSRIKPGGTFLSIRTTLFFLKGWDIQNLFKTALQAARCAVASGAVGERRHAAPTFTKLGAICMPHYHLNEFWKLSSVLPLTGIILRMRMLSIEA